MATDWTLTCEGCASVRTFRDTGHVALREGRAPVVLPFPDAREVATALRADGWDGARGVFENHVCLGCGDVVERLSTAPPGPLGGVLLGLALGVAVVVGLAALGLPPHLGGVGVGLMVAFVPPMVWMVRVERQRRVLIANVTCPRCGSEDVVWPKWVVGRLPCPTCGERAVAFRRRKAVSL
jgi:hypothetical protein